MKKFALVTILTAISASAQAQGVGLPDGTVDVYFQRLSRDGILDGCSLVFTTLMRDTAYLKGEQIVLNGSIAIRNFKDSQLSFTGKLGTRRVSSPNMTWFAPANFYFSTPNGTTAGTAKIIESETPGYRLLIADAFHEKIMAVVTDIIKEAEFTVGFNRKVGGQDVYSVVKMNVALKQNRDGSAAMVTDSKTAYDFSDCMAKLTTDISQRLNKR